MKINVNGVTTEVTVWNNRDNIAIDSNHIAYYKVDDTWVVVGEIHANDKTGITKSISAGSYHTVFLLSDGTVKSVGYNGYGQLGDGTTVDKSTPVSVLNISNCIGISTGIYHTLFLLSDGTCKSVGRNNFGQLGDGTTVDKSIPVDVFNISNCKRIDTGYFYTSFLLTNNTVIDTWVS